MKKSGSRTAIDTSAARLRALVLDCAEGALVGSEDELIVRLGCSRSTVRQVARLLEREGILRVKRGINGGYFASRPDAATIVATVSAYLETLNIDANDSMIVASALWIEAMRKAASGDRLEAQAMVERMRRRLKALPEDASFEKVRSLELDIQAEIFRLADSNYIKLIFDINIAFARRSLSTAVAEQENPEHREFVRRWRDAKWLELNAIVSGDQELAAMAGRYGRKIWHGRVLRRYPVAEAGGLVGAPGESSAQGRPAGRDKRSRSG